MLQAAMAVVVVMVMAVVVVMVVIMAVAGIKEIGRATSELQSPC